MYLSIQSSYPRFESPPSSPTTRILLDFLASPAVKWDNMTYLPSVCNYQQNTFGRMNWTCQ